MRSIMLAPFLLAGALASGQENLVRPMAGSVDVGIIGNLTSAGGVSTYQIDFEGGYYFTDRLVGMARLGFGKHSPAERHYFIGARFALGSGAGSTPYVFAGMEFHDDERNQTAILDPLAGPKATFLEAGLGMQLPLNRSVAAFVELAGFDPFGGSDVGVDLRIGIRVIFPR